MTMLSGSSTGHDEATLASRGIETAAATTAPDAFERAAARGSNASTGHDEATLAYGRAAALAASEAERTFLSDRVESMRATG